MFKILFAAMPCLRYLRRRHRFFCGLLALLWVLMIHRPMPGLAQTAELNRYCQLSQAEVDVKESLRQQATDGDAVAIARYREIGRAHV